MDRFTFKDKPGDKPRTEEILRHSERRQPITFFRFPATVPSFTIPSGLACRYQQTFVPR
jgi:hypothetical protein